MSCDPVAEQLEAYNARDLERFIACYAAGVTVENAAGALLMRGVDELRAAYRGLFAGSPHLRAEVITRIRVGAFVIDEERVRGICGMGASEEWHAAVVYHVVDEHIAHVRLLA